MQWNSHSVHSPFYRELTRSDLPSHRVVVGESDLLISCKDFPAAGVRALVEELRFKIREFGLLFPPFLTALEPVEVPGTISPPPVVKAMLEGSLVAQVGPMASVAGTIAEFVCRFLAQSQSEVIVENGGDCFLVSSKRRTCAVYAGNSPLSLRIGMVLSSDKFPCAMCASSGTVGPSLSLGSPDAAIVVAERGSVADGLATALANRIREPADMKEAVTWAASKHSVYGALAVLHKQLAVKGDIELAKL